MSDEQNTGNIEQSEEILGFGIFLAAFVDELAAEQVLKTMKEAKKSGEFFYDHAAVLRCDAKGKVHISETGDMSAGKGAGIGALIGGVIGLLGGPIGVVVAGAAVGGLAALRDSGFDNDSLKELGAALVPGSSALIATTSKKFVEEVRKQAQEGENQTAAKDIATTIRANLEARQDVLYSLLLTEKGIAARQIISSPTIVAVFGIAASEEGAVAGQAVATADGAAYEVAVATEDEAAYEAGVVTEEGAVVVDAHATAEDQAPEEDEEEETE